MNKIFQILEFLLSKMLALETKVICTELSVVKVFELESFLHRFICYASVGLLCVGIHRIWFCESWTDYSRFVLREGCRVWPEGREIVCSLGHQCCHYCIMFQYYDTIVLAVTVLEAFTPPFKSWRKLYDPRALLVLAYACRLRRRHA